MFWYFTMLSVLVAGIIAYPKLMSTAILELNPGLSRVQNPTLLGFSGLEMLIMGIARPKLMSAVIAMFPKPAMSTGTPPRFEGRDTESTGLSGLLTSTDVMLRCASASNA